MGHALSAEACAGVVARHASRTLPYRDEPAVEGLIVGVVVTFGPEGGVRPLPRTAAGVHARLDRGVALVQRSIV